jgi:predicted Zn-dependent protease
MKAHKKIFYIIIIGCLIILPLSCQHLAAAAGTGAQIAGNAGLIDQNTATAIIQSSEAIGKAAEDITPEQEYYIGRAVAANILSTYRLWDKNPQLTAYLNNICNAIVINSPRPDIYNGYHVMILDSDEINAFATSGGHIFITRGLIAAAKSEDALAGVVAHEIAHIQLQHSVKSIKTSRITQALLITGTSAAGAAAGYDVNELTDVFNESVGEIITTMVNNGYSQTQEFDADNTALGLLAATGYNPSGLLEMLRELTNIQQGNSGGFNKTHPAPAQRIANAEKSLSKHRVTDTSPHRQARYAQNGKI